MSTRSVVLCFAMAVMLPMSACFTSCSSVDEKVSAVKQGTSVKEVIELLGEPASAWGYGLRGEIVFTYEGKKPYSIVFTGPPFFNVEFVHEGRFGGKDTQFEDELTLRIQGKRIGIFRDGKEEIVLDGDEVRFPSSLYPRY